VRSSTRTLAAALLSSAAATAAALLSAVPPASAADHKDAPVVSERPPADINDMYIFKRNGRLVVAMTLNGVSDPDFNGTYNFSPDALYRLAFDVNGDGATDRAIDVTFTPVSGGVQTFTARFPDGTRLAGRTTRPTTLTDIAPGAVITTGGPRGAIRAFAGQRDDPFFFDLVGFNRFVAAHGARPGQTVSDEELGEFRGEDSFAGLNTSVIAFELPVELASGGPRRFGFSGFSYLRADAARSPRGTPTVTVDGVRYEQFDRMGNPAVNTVFIPSGTKDAFNFALPQNDARDFADEALATLRAFATPQANVRTLAAVALPDTLKYDFDNDAGFPNGRQPADDVIDTLLSLVVGRPASDGVDRNDRAFPSVFPYFATPHQPQGADED
jgi:hypothetical protein